MSRKVFSLLALLALLLAACNTNTPPEIYQFSVDPTSGTAPLAVTVTASAGDADGDNLICQVDFGDGSIIHTVPCAGATVNHTYSVGEYTITYSASDGYSTVSRDIQISVSSLPNACPQTSSSGLALQGSQIMDAPKGIAPFAGLAYEPGKLIVYSPPLTLQTAIISKLEIELGIHKLANLSLNGWRVYAVPVGQEKALAQKIIDSGLGEYVQPDYKYKLLSAPNDSYYRSTLNTTYGSANQAQQYGLMKVETAWSKLLSGGCRPIVAVIDSGVAYDHPDLRGSVIDGYDFSDDDNDPYPEAGSDHGTMVASIIGAQTNNHLGMAGVSRNLAYIMPLKVFPNATSSTIAEAIDWAVDGGAHILNLSLCITDVEGKCEDLTDDPDTIIESSLQRAYGNGVVSLAASGNYDDDFIGYPASSIYSIAVGASDNSNPPSRAGFSNYGDALDVVAPGIAVLGAGIPSATNSEPYQAGDGTSFSTPYATGVMALYFSQHYAFNNNLPSPTTAANCIRSAAQDLDPFGFDVFTGMGLVRADRMLDTSNNAYGCY